MTLLAVIMIAYACRYPPIWIGARLTAFTVRFVVG